MICNCLITFKVSNSRIHIFGLKNWPTQNEYAGAMGNKLSKLTGLTAICTDKSMRESCEHNKFSNIPIKSMAMIRTHQTGQQLYVVYLTPCAILRESSLETLITRCFSSKFLSQKLHLRGLPCLWVAIAQKENLKSFVPQHKFF